MEYEVADSTTQALLGRQLKKRTDLKEAKITAAIVFVTNEEGPAVKRPGGIPTDGKLEIRGVKDRIQGSDDLRLLIDFKVWKDMKVGQREALIDHLLCHVEPRKDEKGNLLLDKAKRPKLSRVQYDYHIAGFKKVLEDHGADSPEFVAANEMNEQFGQLLLFAKDPKAVG
jgi:hypothetical protein